MADIAGKTYGMLTAIRKSHQNTEHRWAWLCLCECGGFTTAFKNQLDLGGKKSCGCLVSRPNLTHGRRSHKNYSSWKSMLGRCLNAGNQDYALYGGRGIGVCERWRDINNFIADMGEKPDGLSIDRINNEGNYEPGNCRWATTAQQADNTRNTIYLSLNGSRKTLTEWAREMGTPRQTMYMRYYRGASVEAIINGYS